MARRDNHDERPPGALTRRRLLGLGAVAAGSAAAAPLLGAAGTAQAESARAGTAQAESAQAGTAQAAAAPAYPAAPAGSTLARTLPHGPPGGQGYRRVVTGPGEPSLPRHDLLGTSVRAAGARTPLLAFTQLTDMHVVDAQSPARVEFLDRSDDPGSLTASVAPFSAAYRPWETLSAHVAEAMVQAVNRVARGPVTARRLDFTISTGDNSDNTQYNEVRWHIDLLDGGHTVRPDSGDLTRWEGVGGDTDLDTAYWHPDGTPALGSPDHYTAEHGYPTVPGLLDRCRAPFRSTGLHTPWYSVFGNHDGLVVGNVPSDAVIEAVATGKVKVTGVPGGFSPAKLVERLAAGDFAVLDDLLTAGPVKIVTADPNRRNLTLRQHVAEHFTTTGTPVGHGYSTHNVTNGTAYYAFTRGGVRCLVLDTVNPNGYDDGSIDSVQLAWLTAELDAHSARHLDDTGDWTAGTGADKLLMIFSHHTIATMENVLGTGRVDGAAVRDLLLRYPNVIAWVNGHTHVNSVTPHARAAGSAFGGGFWEINTASHIDWPQQCRIVELVDNGDGTLSVFGTIVDHAAPTSWPASPSAPLELAALSRELAINDPQRDPETATTDGKRGTALDRNVELLLPAPFAR